MSGKRNAGRQGLGDTIDIHLTMVLKSTVRQQSRHEFKR